MKVKCKHCKSKYRITRDVYDDIEYLGRHVVKCRFCSNTFDVKLNGFMPIAVKHRN